MPKVVRLEATGDSSVLQVKDVAVAQPPAGEALLEQEAVGVNYLDVTQRKGAVPIPLPSGLGLEGAGRVVSVGSDVTNVKPGDRVAYIMGPIGSYASARCFPADRLVALPDDVSFEDAAATLFKGVTAQYLIKTTYPVGPETSILLYGVAGPVGQLLCQWAKHLGASVFGVVSKAASVDRARAAGADHVLVWGECDLPAEIARLTDGRKVDVVYDGIGKLTFDASIDCLRPRGLMVSFGASTGAPDPVSVGTLNAKGSLYLTRPGLAVHVAKLEDYRERMADVIEALRSGIITSPLSQIMPLDDVRKAHELIEAGEAQGAVVLRP